MAHANIHLITVPPSASAPSQSIKRKSPEDQDEVQPESQAKRQRGLNTAERDDEVLSTKSANSSSSDDDVGEYSLSLFWFQNNCICTGGLITPFSTHWFKLFNEMLEILGCSFTKASTHKT